MCWLSPKSAPLVAVLVVAGIALPYAFQPLISERDLRLRTYEGSLSRFYLDAMLGLIPVRAHVGERVIRRQHEGLLVDWIRAGLRLQWTSILVDGLTGGVNLALAAALLYRHLAGAAATGAASALLLMYWTLQLPVLADEIAQCARQYPSLRNVALRLLEVLRAPDEEDPTSLADGQERSSVPSPAIEPGAVAIGSGA